MPSWRAILEKLIVHQHVGPIDCIALAMEVPCRRAYQAIVWLIGVPKGGKMIRARLVILNRFQVDQRPEGEIDNRASTNDKGM